MKKIILCLFATAFFFGACSDNDYLVYDADGINHLCFTTDSIYFEYGFYEDMDTEIVVPLSLLGIPPMEEGETMEFSLSFGDETNVTEGEEFRFLNTGLMTDSVNCIKIDILKDNLELNRECILVLDIEENENFAPAGLSRCYIKFGYMELSVPDWWLESKLGTYTIEKHVMFVNLFWATEETSPYYYALLAGRFGYNLELTYKPYTTDMTPLMLSTSTYSSYFLRYMYVPMSDYYIATGDPLYEVPYYEE